MGDKSFVTLSKSKSIDIEFQDITLSTKERGNCIKPIIKGVSGKFLSGQLTAIMGPSGAGKTSLLNVLTGFQRTGITGSIKCSNGDTKKQGALQYKKESCYILQEDNLSPLFTVQETMKMTTNLKISSLSDKAKEFLIQDILSNLGLLKSRNTRCQNLSGGQKKRLSVALELIDNPPIMFLDEPTTGLDSSSSVHCIHMLKKLALSGKSIICTIHQPTASLYELFDHVYVMAEGKCIYQGASSNTVPYLSSLGFNCPQYHNPADFFLEVANGDYGNFTDVLVEAADDKKWRRNIPSIRTGEEKNGIQKNTVECNMEEAYSRYRHPSECARFWVLLKRTGLQIYRDWTISQLKVVMHLLVGIFLGITFQNSGQDASKAMSNVGLFFCGTIYLAYTSVMPAVLKFPSELTILRKERFNNWYKLKTYYTAFMAFDIPLQVISSLAYTSTSYFISSQPCELKRFLMVLLIYSLMALSSSGLGLILGSLVNPINGTFFAAITLALMVCVSGLLIFFTHMSTVMYLLSYLSFLSYTVEGSMQAVYGFSRASLTCPEDAFYCQYTSPELLLKDVGMDKQNYWIDVGYLLSSFVIFRIIAFYTLKKKISSI